MSYQHNLSTTSLPMCVLQLENFTYKKALIAHTSSSNLYSLFSKPSQFPKQSPQFFPPLSHLPLSPQVLFASSIASKLSQNCLSKKTQKHQCLTNLQPIIFNASILSIIVNTQALAIEVQEDTDSLSTLSSPPPPLVHIAIQVPCWLLGYYPYSVDIVPRCNCYGCSILTMLFCLTTLMIPIGFPYCLPLQLIHA